MEENPQYILSSLDHALDILGLFFEREELTASQAAASLGLSRTAAFRMLYTLAAKGLLSRAANGSWRLGIKLFSLGQLTQSRMVLTGLVRPQLSRLADETGETAHLAVMDGPEHIVFVDKALGRLNLKMDTVLGERRRAHETATGKMLLAMRTPEQREAYARSARFERSTPNTITDPAALLRELELTRERGWAIDNEESEEGLTCLAVALIDPSGAAVAAISCSGPSTRMERSRAERLAALRRAARAVSLSGG